MNTIGTWIEKASAQPQVHSVLHALYVVLVPSFLQAHRRGHASSLASFTIADVERIAHSFLWFLVIGIVVYALSVGRPGKPGLARFSYALPVSEPGQKLSLFHGLKYLVPRSFYSHASFKIDMLWLPFSLILSFFGLLGMTLGAGVVQSWLLHRFGHSPLSMRDGGVSVALQVVIILLARDFGRFMWHYQGHMVPFFWEFHKGHHSAEVLHPLGVRTHPVDLFIRNTYTGVGGGLIAGSLIYLLGMSFSVTAASYVASTLAVFLMLQRFEHSHVRVSFGKTLDRFFYAPYMHHFHHGARLEHMNVNLGITGGLILWDYLFRTLHRPQPGEKIIWGASMEELGANNPHRTLWGFFSGPFIGAFRVLQRRSPGDLTQPVPAAGGSAGTTAA